MPVNRKTTASKATPSRRSEEAPSDNGGSKKGGAKDKSSAFDSVRPQGKVDDAKYEAIISELVLQDPDEKGQSVRLKYEIASAGDFRGVEVTQWYKVFEADGETPGKGASFLKKDLAVLDYEDVKFDDLEEVFEEIVEKNIGVVIQVKNNGAFVNAYLQGLAEGSDIIKEYLENRPGY